MGKTNIVITGFMGTGKTSIGTLVAQKLGREFIDTDQLIAKRLGLSINEIFEKFGESFFRTKEKEVLLELSKKSNLVISTGGGSLVPKENQKIMEKNSLIFCLQCDTDEIIKRTSNDNSRPLLKENKHIEIQRLLKRRESAYNKIKLQINTTRISIDEAADEIINIYLNQQ